MNNLNSNILNRNDEDYDDQNNDLEIMTMEELKLL